MDPMSGGGTPIILAIDLGTSGPKVALATPTGEILAHCVEQTPVILLPDGGAEQDPEVWWAAIRRGVRRVLAETAVLPVQIKAVCCTTQWSGTVPVDAAGRPLHNAIIWMDARGASHVHRVTGGWPKVEGYGLGKILKWVRRTGGIPTHSGKDSIAHILYLKAEKPELYRRTHKFLEPKDYLNCRLTGKFASSYETITLHWVTDNRDIENVGYDPELLDLVGIVREKLPDLRAAVDRLGPIAPDVAVELGLSPQTQVVMGTPDLHSAAIGSGAVADYAAHLYIGTSSWLSCHVPFKKTDLFHNMASLPAAIPGRYFVVNEQEAAGICLNFLRDNLLFPGDALDQTNPPDDFYARLDGLAASVPAGSAGLLFTPWLNGERSPVDDNGIRGGFHNLQLAHTRAHLARAVLEGVALNTRWLLGYVEKFCKRPFPHLHFIGGGAQSALWGQIFADVLDRPMHVVAQPLHANARGAAILAGVALGLTSFAAAAVETAVAHVYHPNPANRQLYANSFAAFRYLYQKNRRLSRWLPRF